MLTFSQSYANPLSQIHPQFSSKTNRAYPQNRFHTKTNTPPMNTFEPL